MKNDVLEKRLQNIIKSFEIEDFKMSQEHISILKGVAYGKLNSNLLIIERKKRLLKG
ncbi:MAG: hypothetical protein Q7K48_00145 [Fusobacterium sp. JB021]|nr:hypothetical protein [Fusobacterium sp. JB021]MDP0506845.1 hypothetical protein [Fusobacterium sp. JB019]